MKELAEKGRGLNTHVNQHVRKAYETKDIITSESFGCLHPLLYLHQKVIVDTMNDFLLRLFGWQCFIRDDSFWNLKIYSSVNIF